MRNQVVFAALAVALTASLAGAAPRPYEKLVAPFDPSPYVLPTGWPKEYIKDMPDRDGSLVSNAGAGAMSRNFYEWLVLWLRPWANSRQALDRECVVWQETVTDMSGTLKQSIAKASGDQLQKFNHDVGGQIKVELLGYKNARAKEAIASKGVENAMLKAKAALKDVEHNEELTAAQAAADRKASLAATKAQIEAEIAQSKQVKEIFDKALGTAVDIVGIIQNPAGSATKIFGMVTGGLIGLAIDEHESDLMILDLQMQALDEAIDKHKHGAQEAALAKAKILLQAAGIEVVQKMLEEQQIIQTQGQALDNLADLEKGARLKKSPDATDVFYDLRITHQQFLLAATDLRRRVAVYKLVIDHGPGRRAAEWSPVLSKAITQVSSYDKPDPDWIIVARRSRDYMEKQAAWYPKESGYVAGQVKFLADRIEVLPIDEAVELLLAKFN